MDQSWIDWTAAAGIGALLAVGVAVWAVIIAHRANEIAKAGLPRPAPEIEVRHGEGLALKLFNVGDAALSEVTVHRVAGAILIPPAGEPVTLYPGDDLEFGGRARPSGEILWFEVHGFEDRDGTRIARTFELEAITRFQSHNN